MWTFILIYLVFSAASGENDEDFRLVKLDSGIVRGDKFWNGDYYEFYGIPYASLPTGRNKFKGPEPAKPWEDVFYANSNNILCHQCYYTEGGESVMLAGEEECLTINVLVPIVVNDTNLAPVVVYIHSGAFSGGSGNMAKFGYLARHDIVVVSFNYRVGAFGFACLGNEEIPGNAALRDQVAALRWIKKNIKNFGGDPSKITLAGFSVGAAMAELLALSKATDGIINQLILESGSALSPFTINRDPVSTAWNTAQAIGYNGTASIEDLTEFYLNAEVKNLAKHSLNYFLPNSTFGFAPCIEKVQEGVEAIITESPLDILKRGDYHKIPVITGFSNMEGLSRTIKFGTWRDDMNENFANFIPADLKFDTEQDKEEVIKEIKQYYFDNQNVTHASLAKYIDYFSDAMFKYAIMKSAKLHAAASEKPVYLYEFAYVGKLNIQHNYMDRIKGASHRDQTAYILDFFGFTNNYRDLDTRERMTTMWSDYVRYGDPTKFESSIITVKWPLFTNELQKYLEIDKKLQVKQGLFNEEYDFWNKIYEKYYWNPTTVKSELNIAYNKEKTIKKTTSKNKPVHSEKNESIKTSSEKMENDPKKNMNDNKNMKSEEHESLKLAKEMLNNENNQLNKMKRTTTIKKINEDGKLVTEVSKHSDIPSEIINTDKKTNLKDTKIEQNKREQVQQDKIQPNGNEEGIKIKTDAVQGKQNDPKQNSKTQKVEKKVESKEDKKDKPIIQDNQYMKIEKSESIKHAKDMPNYKENQLNKVKRTTTIKKINEHGKLVTEVKKDSDIPSKIINTDKNTIKINPKDAKIEQNKREQVQQDNIQPNEEGIKIKTDVVQGKGNDPKLNSKTQNVGKEVENKEDIKDKPIIKENEIKTVDTEKNKPPTTIDNKQNVKQESNTQKVDKSSEDKTNGNSHIKSKTF